MTRYLLALMVALAIMFTYNAYAQRLKPERLYQEQWCEAREGIIEYTLEDRTRVDCLTSTHAIEHDFANKWAEAIGQSLHYARLTGLRAGIVLIAENEKDIRYYQRVLSDIEYHDLPIDVWIVPGYY